MKLKAILLAAAAIVGAPAVAAADEVTTSVNIGVASEYIWRGASQNLDSGQVFAGADLGYGMFYLGTWGSNVDFGGDAQFELDVYGGIKPKLGPIQFDFGVLGYLYPSEDTLNLWEFKAAGTIANEAGLSLTAALFYSPEVGDGGPSSLYSELSASAPIPGAKIGPFALSVGAALGYYDYDDTYVDYTNWKLGITAATENGWAIDVFYTDTDDDNDVFREGKGVVQLKRTF
jgi:uncharacterized protein (TIGR02001 family)